MNQKNSMVLKIPSLSENESFSRVVVGAFAARLNPTIEEIADIKTAVSEAVTNCIVHAYKGRGGYIEIRAYIDKRSITIEISDLGRGIEDVEQARQPFFSTVGGEERSGMGFTVMETFMDSVNVISEVGKGTTVIMRKDIGEDAQ
ncbi:MAG: anti-sigma F factor [Eubacteriales bacterium]